MELRNPSREINKSGHLLFSDALRPSIADKHTDDGSNETANEPLGTGWPFEVIATNRGLALLDTFPPTNHAGLLVSRTLV